MRAVGVLSPHPHWVIGLGTRGLGTVELPADGVDLPPEVDVVVVEPRSADEAGEVTARLRGARDDVGLVLLLEDGWARPTDLCVEVVTTPASVARICEAVLHLRGRVDPLDRLELEQILGTDVAPPPGHPAARTPLDEAPVAPASRPDAVTHLLELCDEVARTHLAVPEVAGRLAAEVASRVGADVAVIDHDDGHLRVVGGHGLRPLEWREIEGLPAVLHHLTDERPALCVNDTDTLRAQLGGLPLSRHPCLLLVAGAVVPVLLVVGRQAHFTDDEVRQVMALQQAASGPLGDALRLRTAVAVLAPFGAPR